MVKLVIWDLDDTLWQGTLADGEAVVPFAHRFDLVRRLNDHGVVSAICSKNDPARAEAHLREFGLWDQFVFPSIAFAPKGPAVAGIIGDMQLRAPDVLFVDDNRANLQEVGHMVPGIQLLDITAPDADAVLEAIFTSQKASRNRVGEYRILEAKKRDRVDANLSNEDFLFSCSVEACAPFLMDNLDFLDRVVELVNRSNQLNYTQSRVEPAALRSAIIDVVRYDSWSIFAWDKYGDYGLVGFVMVDRASQRFVHFTFSCRVMHMGLESYALRKVREKWPAIDASHWADRFSLVPPGWIADRSFHDPAIRAQRLASLGGEAGGEVRARIMYDCQSGGIAHFSRHRAAIEFDNNPRLFGMRHVLDGTHRRQRYPDAIIFGPGIDYSNPRWPAQMIPHLGQVYGDCVDAFCSYFAPRVTGALILLCPEAMPDAKYRPHMGHTRERTVALNAEWRRAAAAHRWITLVELDAIVAPDMLSDVSHYHPTALQQMADTVDAWLDGVARQDDASFAGLSDEAFVTAGQAVLAENRLAVLPQLLASLAAREALAGGEAGQTLLIQALVAIVGMCGAGEVAIAARSIRAGGADLAALGAALLEQAVTPGGALVLSELADGTLLALALLIGIGGDPARAEAMLAEAGPARAGGDFPAAAAMVRDEIAEAVRP
ncbi:hypothetical protein ACX40Y_13475 [Sphingomonas sp. RS6]